MPYFYKYFLILCAEGVHRRLQGEFWEDTICQRSVERSLAFLWIALCEKDDDSSNSNQTNGIGIVP